MSDGVKFKLVDVDADANFKLGEGSGKITHRSETGLNSSINLVNVGAKAEISTLKAVKPYGDGAGTLSAQGPSVGADIGLQVNEERIGIDALAEASVAKAKATAGPAFAEANLNANTGAKIGTDGVKVAFLGFGLTLGVGGRWSLDSPVGSVGASTATNSNTNAVTNQNHAHNHNVRYN